MKQIVYRNCSLGLLIVSIIICGVTISLSGMGLYVALFSKDPAFVPIIRHFVIFGCAGYCISCILFIVMSCIEYTEKIIISEDAVELQRGKQKIRCISSQDITVCGCAAFVHRGGYVFFCSNSLEEILAFSQINSKKARQYFGKSRMVQAKTDSDLEFQIAVGTYIHSQRRKNNARIIILKSPGPKTLKEIRDILHQEPIRTGPILMDYPNQWTE